MKTKESKQNLAAFFIYLFQDKSTGIEPATQRLSVFYSNQLSYEVTLTIGIALFCGCTDQTRTGISSFVGLCRFRLNDGAFGCEGKNRTYKVERQRFYRPHRFHLRATSQ